MIYICAVIATIFYVSISAGIIAWAQLTLIDYLVESDVGDFISMLAITTFMSTAVSMFFLLPFAFLILH